MCTCKFQLVWWLSDFQILVGNLNIAAMTNVRADSLDDFLPYIQTSDTKKRLHTYEQLVGYLRCSYTSLECRNMEKMIDGLIAWISSSNYKVFFLFFFDGKGQRVVYTSTLAISQLAYGCGLK